MIVICGLCMFLQRDVFKSMHANSHQVIYRLSTWAGKGKGKTGLVVTYKLYNRKLLSGQKYVFEHLTGILYKGTLNGRKNNKLKIVLH